MIARRLLIGVAIFVLASADATGQAPAHPLLRQRDLKQWIEDLSSQDALIRDEAMEVLSVVGAPAKEATSKLEEIAKDDPLLATRCKAAFAVFKLTGRSDLAIPLFTEAAKTAKGPTRLRAIQSLVDLGKKRTDVAGYLVDILMDPDIYVQSQATTEVYRYGSDVIPALAAELRTATGTRLIRLIGVVRGLSTRAAPLLPLLNERMAKDTESVQANLLSAIWVIDSKNPELPSKLTKLASSSNLEARRTALNFALSLNPKPKSLQPLFVAALKDSDGQFRCRAAVALFEADKANLKTAVNMLLAEIKDPDKPHWPVAVTSLGQFGHDAAPAIPILTEIVKAPERRNSAMTVLQVLPRIGPAALPLVAEMLAHSDYSIRSMAIQALSGFGPEAVPKLAPLLTDRNSPVRMQALDAVQRYGPGAKPALPQLIEILKGDDPNFKNRAAQIIGEIGPEAKDAVPGLLAYAKEEQQPSFYRANGIEALGKVAVGNKEVAAWLVEAIKSKDQIIRFRAAEAMGRLGGSKESMEVLTTTLGSGENTSGVTLTQKAQALVAHGAPPGEVFKALLEAHAKMPKTYPRVEMMGIVTTHYPEASEAIPLLKDLIKDSNQTVREQAALQLAKFGKEGVDAVPILTEALKRQSTFTLAEAMFQGFAKLGPVAKAAAPELLDRFQRESNTTVRANLAGILLLVDPEKAGACRTWLNEQLGQGPREAAPVAYVLARAEPNNPKILSILTALLKEENRYYVAPAAEALGRMGAPAKAAVPDLRRLLSDPHPATRAGAALALWRIEKNAAEVVPVLAKMVNEADPLPPGATYYFGSYQWTGAIAAVGALGEIGPAAKMAIIALKAGLSVGDPSLRAQIRAALRKIDPSFRG